MFCTGSIVAWSQVSTFKKIMNEKDEVDREIFFSRLQSFQKEYIEFSNVYYQMGNVEFEIFKTLDPITDRIESRQRIYNVKINYALAKNYLDTKEIPRFPQWYGLNENTSKDSLIFLGEKKLDDANKNTARYSKDYEELVSNYDNAVSYYLRAREGFIAINNTAENLRQLFLEANDELKTSVNQVGDDFDSCMYYIDKYRSTYQQLPHVKKRKVEVNLKRIDHFRMNGITPANFLADRIDMWDYGLWSREFLELLKVEVDGLQDQVKEAYTQFLEINEKMLHGSECIQATFDNVKYQRIINLITKYDNQSVLADIFRYLIAKLDYGNEYVYERNCNVLEDALNDDLVSRKARIYQGLFQKWIVADSLNSQIVTSGHTEATFIWFFNEMLDGEGGSLRFSESQQKEDYTSFKGEVTHLQDLASRQYFKSDSIINTCFERQENLLVWTEDSLATNVCLSGKLMVNDTLHFLLSQGHEKNTLVGASPNELDYDLLWEIAPYKGKTIDFFKSAGDSSFVIGGNSQSGWIGYYSYTGELIMNASLRSSDTIVNVTVNQLQGVMKVTQVANGQYTISYLNFAGKQTKSIAIELSGTFISMFELGKASYIFTSETPNGIIANQIDAEGVIENQVSYTLNSELRNTIIVKNDNQFITLLADGSVSDEIVYALLDYQGKVKYEKVY